MILLYPWHPQSCSVKGCGAAGVMYYYAVLFEGELVHPSFCRKHAESFTSIEVEWEMAETGQAVIIEDEDEEKGEVQEVAAITAEAKDTLAMAKEFQVTSQEDLVFAGEVLQEVKSRAKRLDTLKKSITAPLNEALKAARDMFRPAEEALDGIEKEFKGAVARFNNEQARKAAEAARAVREAETAAQAKAALVARAEAEVQAPKGVTMREVWKFEIVDADQVPREYCAPVRSLIQADIDNGLREIPGVRVYKDTQVAVRAK